MEIREKIYEKTGFAFSFVIFTIVFSLMFKLLNKVPSGWNYSHFFSISFIMVLIGGALKKFLK